MRRRGASQVAIEAELLTENLEKCEPPLPEDEVKAIARSVARYAPEDGSITNLDRPENAVVMNVDEKPSIQALERAQVVFHQPGAVRSFHPVPYWTCEHRTWIRC